VLPTEAFRTERLIAERLRDEHFDELRRMHRDPRVTATLGPPGAPDGLLSDEETRQFLRRHLDHWNRYGYGLWAFRDRTDGRFVGRAGLYNTHVGGNDEVELAYALMAEYWNRGLATEMAGAILSVAFERLGIEELVCFTLTTNRASQRVMEKAGFEYERDVVHAGQPHVLYRVTASGKIAGSSGAATLEQSRKKLAAEDQIIDSVSQRGDAGEDGQDDQGFDHGG
jgi:ribosomal-protein-alanine N-acetyltransferase